MSDSITLTICGDGGCGKSSLTLRIVRGAWTHEYDPTIEDSYSVTRTIDGRVFSLSITDTAGQEEYRSMFSASNVHSDAFLLVYSITSRQSLEMLDVWSRMVQEEWYNREEDGRVRPGVMVVGNKCDLGREREVTAAEGLEWARSRGYGFMETSARECVNVEETFSALIRRVVEARRMHATGEPSPLPPNSPQALRSPYLDSASYKTEKTAGSPRVGTSASTNKFPQSQQQQSKKGFWSSLKCW
ncbi:ras-domain-containing protein [Myriangium duriaei CBS 260.36]|uniref:Ras-domain-containing protein n=1 Tax=Myriangium duriaei CBS 260.36 TaxID=1168546 RepID=A0A9P4J8T8_9PEZI|nr:ras-domain-containing protein [Myriangium duriaei CBS 260.36]